MEDLNTLRARLDELDKTLVRAYEERCRIAEQVGRYKLENGLPVKDAAREKEVVKKRLEYLSSPDFSSETEAFMQEIMLQSRRIQRRLLRQHEESPKNGNYFLVGLPGSGKTSVGKVLAAAEGMDFLDTDEYIAEKEGLSVSDIFAQKGEDYFRTAETNALKEIAKTVKNTVISTGGGIVERDENLGILSDLLVIYLYRPIKQILRGKMANRPLLAADPQKIYALDRRRRPRYEQIADYTIGNIGGVQATAGYIQKQLDK